MNKLAVFYKVAPNLRSLHTSPVPNKAQTVTREQHYYEKEKLFEVRNLSKKSVREPLVPCKPKKKDCGCPPPCCPPPPSDDKTQVLMDIANRLRILSIQATDEAGSGHPTSCSSIAEIMSVLFFDKMRYDVACPKHLSADRFVLSKGHACPILYAAWSEAGLFPASCLKSLRKFGYNLEGHPTPRLPFIDVATGSLGQGASNAAGIAYVGKYFDKGCYRVYCLIGDGESAEGSVWEAIAFASHYKLENLCFILDVNRLGQSGQTALGCDIETYRNRVAAFGANPICIDGHCVPEIVQAFCNAEKYKCGPTVIIAKTVKGKHFPGIEDEEGWHGKVLGKKSECALKHICSLIKCKEPKICAPPKPQGDATEIDLNVKLSCPPNYQVGQMVSTRAAYGTALVKLAETNCRVIGLDADVKNSTYAEMLKEFDCERFIECYIAEQNLVGVAIGTGCRNRTIPFASTFAAFFTRAFDQIRMGAISQSNVNFVGSHAGVSVGEDGPSQMGLEDLAMFRTIPCSTIFYPSDAVATERAIELAAQTKGITYTRTTRPCLAVIYRNEDCFRIGKANLVKNASQSKALIIAAGVTLAEAICAGKILEKCGICVRILDPFTIKPIDVDGIKENACESCGRIVVVEDHYEEGGLGEAVMAAVADEPKMIVKHLAVPKIPRSGCAKALLDYYGISSKHIVAAVKKLVN